MGHSGAPLVFCRSADRRGACLPVSRRAVPHLKMLCSLPLPQRRFCSRPHAVQQRKLEQARDSAVLAEELGIGAYLQQLASTENAGCPVTMLQTEPFTDAQGEVGRPGGACTCHAAPASDRATRLLLLLLTAAQRRCSPPAKQVFPFWPCCAEVRAVCCGRRGRRHSVCG